MNPQLSPLASTPIRHVLPVATFCIVMIFPTSLTAQPRAARVAIRVNPLQGAQAQAVQESAGETPDPRTATLAAGLRDSIESLAGGKSREGGMFARLLPQQRRAFLSLRDRIGVTPEIRLRRTGTPLEIKGTRLEPALPGMLPGPERDIETARAFLRANRTLLRLTDPDRELSLSRSELDDLGKRHLRFEQVWDGLPVWPAELLVHIDEAGNVEEMNGAYVPSPKGTATEPVLLAAEAAALARDAVPGAQTALTDAPMLVIYAPEEGTPRLAWKVEVLVSATSRWLTMIDALTGALLTAFNLIPTANVVGSGVDLLGETRPLNAFEEGGTFFLVDTSKAMFDPTSDPPSPGTTRGAIIILDAAYLFTACLTTGKAV